LKRKLKQKTLKRVFRQIKKVKSVTNRLSENRKSVKMSSQREKRTFRAKNRSALTSGVHSCVVAQK